MKPKHLFESISQEERRVQVEAEQTRGKLFHRDSSCNEPKFSSTVKKQNFKGRTTMPGSLGAHH